MHQFSFSKISHHKLRPTYIKTECFNFLSQTVFCCNYFLHGSKIRGLSGTLTQSVQYDFKNFGPGFSSTQLVRPCVQMGQFINLVIISVSNLISRNLIIQSLFFLYTLSHMKVLVHIKDNFTALGRIRCWQWQDRLIRMVPGQPVSFRISTCLEKTFSSNNSIS